MNVFFATLVGWNYLKIMISMRKNFYLNINLLFCIYTILEDFVHSIDIFDVRFSPMVSEVEKVQTFNRKLDRAIFRQPGY